MHLLEPCHRASGPPCISQLCFLLSQCLSDRLCQVVAQMVPSSLTLTPHQFSTPPRRGCFALPGVPEKKSRNEDSLDLSQSPWPKAWSILIVQSWVFSRPQELELDVVGEAGAREELSYRKVMGLE